MHRSWSLAIPAEFTKPVSHDIKLSVEVSAWLQNFPELLLLTHLSFQCLLRPAEARQLRWCDVNFLNVLEPQFLITDSPTLRKFPATAPQPWRVRSTLHAPYHSLRYRDKPLLRRRGRWSSEKTLERQIQEATFLLHQNQLSKEVTDRLSALAERSTRFFAEQDYERVPPPIPTATTLQRKR